MAVEEGKRYPIKLAEPSYLMKILNSLKDMAKAGELADCESAHKRAIDPTSPEQNPAKKSRPDQKVMGLMHIETPQQQPTEQGEIQDEEEPPSLSSNSLDDGQSLIEDITEDESNASDDNVEEEDEF